MVALTLNNTTGSDVEIVDLGFTVPASGTYDLRGRSQQLIADSTELANAIVDGTLQLIANAAIPSYWSASEALEIFQNGINKGILGLGDDTGYLTLASGGTADRPNVPTGGMTRYNSDTGYVEMYQQGQWHNMPLLANNSVSMADDGRGPILYFHDPAADKKLSVTIATTEFASTNTQNKTWLQVQSAFTGASVGFRVAYNLTISIVRGYSETASNKSVSMFIDDTEYANALVWTENIAADTNIVSGISSIDADAGQKIRFRVLSDTKGSLGAMALTVFYQLRGS